MVLTPKKPHIGNIVIHPQNGLHYAYYGTVATQERAEALIKKFNSERQWAFLHEVPNIGFSVFHRHATLDHARIPFGKVPPKTYVPIEQAILAAQKVPKKHAQVEPGSKDTVVSKQPRVTVTLSEQEKRAKKIERRAIRRLKKKEKKSEEVVQSVLGQLRPDLRL